MLGHGRFTPNATDAAKYPSDVERVNLCYYLLRIWLLLHLNFQARVWIGYVPIHLAGCFEAFERFMGIYLHGEHGPFVRLCLRLFVPTIWGWKGAQVAQLLGDISSACSRHTMYGGVLGLRKTDP